MKPRRYYQADRSIGGEPAGRGSIAKDGYLMVANAR